MRLRSLLLAPALVALAAGVSDAQDAGTIELGAFGRYTRFSADGVPLTNRVGAGLRAAYFFSPVLSLEADVSRTLTHNRVANAGWVTYYPYHLRATLNLPVAERVSALIGAGLAVDRYGRTGHDSDLGVAGVAGLRTQLSHLLAIRIDATADYIGHRANNAPAKYWNLGVEAGVSVMLGGKHGAGGNADDDGDGVANAGDRCPGTPPGTAVDGSGCTQRADSDKDGVIDINDVCPDTPAGAKVDANGCSGTEPKSQGSAAGAGDGRLSLRPALPPSDARRLP